MGPARQSVHWSLNGVEVVDGIHPSTSWSCRSFSLQLTKVTMPKEGEQDLPGVEQPVRLAGVPLGDAW